LHSRSKEQESQNKSTSVNPKASKGVEADANLASEILPVNKTRFIYTPKTNKVQGNLKGGSYNPKTEEVKAVPQKETSPKNEHEAIKTKNHQEERSLTESPGTSLENVSAELKELSNDDFFGFKK